MCLVGSWLCVICLVCVKVRLSLYENGVSEELLVL